MNETAPKIANAPAADETSGAIESRSTAAPLSTPKFTPTHGQPFHHGYLLKDATLFHPRLTADAKVLLAFTLAYPNHSPSLTELEQAAGLRRDRALAAQLELEREEIARFDRPKHPWERNPISKKFLRPTRLAWVAPDHDAVRSKDRTVFVHGAFARQLPTGTRRGSTYRLTVIALAREQFIRGAIQVEDDALAELLGNVTARQVRTVKDTLKASGDLARDRHDSPCEVLTFPQLHDQEPKPDELHPEQTRRLAVLQLPCYRDPITVYANPGEVAALTHRVAKAGPHQTAAALLNLATRDFTSIYRDDDFAAGRDTPPLPPTHARDLFAELAAVAANPPTFQLLNEIPRNGLLVSTEWDTGSTGTSDLNPKDLYAPAARESLKGATEAATGHWPPGVADRALALFGPRALRPGSRTHIPLDRAVRHALDVWTDKYAPGGDLSLEQNAYAATRLLTALEYLATLPADRDRYAAIPTAILRVINDDDTHAGFQALPAATPADTDELVDVGDVLANI